MANFPPTERSGMESVDEDPVSAGLPPYLPARKSALMSFAACMVVALSDIFISVGAMECVRYWLQPFSQA